MTTSPSSHPLPSRAPRPRRLGIELVAVVILCTFGAVVLGFGHHLLSTDHGAGDHDCVVCKAQSSTSLPCDLSGVPPTQALVGEALWAPTLPSTLLAYLTGPPLRGPPAS